MPFALAFSLDANPETEARQLERLKEGFELANMDKEEQAIDPDNFSGNLPDYPQWVRDAFRKPELLRELEEFCEFEEGELKDWTLEDWYEEMTNCDAYNYHFQPSEEPGRHLLVFEADDEHYGGDIAHALVLLAAGAGQLESKNEAVRPKAGTVTATDDSIDPEELSDMYDQLEDNTDARPEF
jgi:hypothetical protein